MRGYSRLLMETSPFSFVQEPVAYTIVCRGELMRLVQPTSQALALGTVLYHGFAMAAEAKSSPDFVSQENRIDSSARCQWKSRFHPSSLRYCEIYIA